MISKAQILDEDRVPDRDLVAHREEELDRLMQILKPEGTGPSKVSYLIGPSGTGKTMLAKLTFDLLADDPSMPGHEMAYVNTWDHDKRTAILFQAVDQLCDRPVHRQSTGRSRMISMLNDAPEYPRYLIIDEADQLVDTDVLYDLYEIPNLYLILIGNREEDLFANMADRVRSRIEVGPRTECGLYAAQEIAEILQRRADAALGGAQRHMEAIDYIAANADGNARTAIRALRDGRNLSSGITITRDDVAEALPKAREALRQKSRDRLGPHQKTVLEVVEAADEPLRTATVDERYRDQITNPRSKRQVRTYLSKLTEYNHVERLTERPATWGVPSEATSEID